MAFATSARHVVLARMATVSANSAYQCRLHAVEFRPDRSD
jgi:hypothetical protein